MKKQWFFNFIFDPAYCLQEISIIAFFNALKLHQNSKFKIINQKCGGNIP